MQSSSTAGISRRRPTKGWESGSISSGSLTTLTGGRTLLRALYYIGEWNEENYALLQELKRGRMLDSASLPPPDPGESERKRAQQQGFIRMLNRNGYQVVKKPVRVFADGNTKADLDIELAIDMLTLADRCERMVLVSGDSDFVPVIRAVGMRGVRDRSRRLAAALCVHVDGRTSARISRARLGRITRCGRRVHRTQGPHTGDRTPGTAASTDLPTARERVRKRRILSGGDADDHAALDRSKPASTHRCGRRARSRAR